MMEELADPFGVTGDVRRVKEILPFHTKSLGGYRSRFQRVKVLAYGICRE